MNLITILPKKIKKYRLISRKTVMSNSTATLPLPTIRRFPLYLQILEQLKQEGVYTVSATEIAKTLGLKAIQVRKDLATTGVTGKPKVGFSVPNLINALKEALGWSNTSEAFLVGAGALGSALLGFAGFQKRGLKILAAFDTNPHLEGKEIHGKRIFPLTKLENLVQRMGVQIGIITTPPEVAQEVANLLVTSGVQAIWNFSAAPLKLPKEIVLQQEDLSSGLAVLSMKLSEALKKNA